MLTIDMSADMPNVQPPVALVAQVENAAAHGGKARSFIYGGKGREFIDWGERNANPNGSKDVVVRYASPQPTALLMICAQ
ncbi:MAG: hypothetical protein FWG81_04280 [Betaproteobacteria bacterium]|nr:hypothetical protein [Betaproteobacteria bacterium]